MALIKKRAPSSGDAKLDRIIRQVYSDINELINSVNSSDTNREKLNTDGKSGDIRVVKNSNGIYAIEAKTEDGWITTNVSTAANATMQIKDKE